MLYKNLLRPLLFMLDAEHAHDYTHRIGSELSNNPALLSVVQSFFDLGKTGLSQMVAGIRFDSPVGLAAGFDKNAHLMVLMQSIGFGFVEVGSITALASEGNSKPRLIRLPDNEALINRMGLNNDGAKVVTNRVKKSKGNLIIPVGVNIAKTHSSSILGDAAIRDYINSFVLAQEVADYITVNISCPNTEEGKTFEDPEALAELINSINAVRTGTCPVFMKLSADLNTKELDVLLDLCQAGNIDGYVLTNTTSTRKNLSIKSLAKASSFGRGGMSGKPLYENMIELVRHTYQETGRQKPIIAVGGIDSPEKALNTLKNGASLVQVYTGLVYEGPFLVNNMNRYIQNYLRTHQLSSLDEIRA